MAYQGRTQHSAMRHPSMGSVQPSSGQSPILVARITEKRTELENLKQLRDLSAAVAAQMQTLEEKLSLLSDGTEGLFSVFVHMPPLLIVGAQPWQQCSRTGTMSYEPSTWPQVGSSPSKCQLKYSFPNILKSENSQSKGCRREG